MNVSIPYRLATNKLANGVEKERIRVSIPYRLATNLFITGTGTNPNEFQFLIGWLQTGQLERRKRY